jgi:hypothetical protein
MTEQKSLILTNRFDLMSNFGREAEQVFEAVHNFAEEHDGEIMDVDEIYFGQHGKHIKIYTYPSESASKIAREVKSYIASKRAQYTIIVGDETSIPMFEACGIHTDFFYSYLDEDGLPGASVARILGSAEAMIRQLRGNKQPGNRVLILCSEDTRIHLETRTFLKVLQDSGIEVVFRAEEAADILHEFDFIIHFGHGTDTGISNRFGQPYVTESSMPDLPRHPVALVDGCATAPPGSKLLRAFMNKGCVAYLGSSVGVAGMIPARYACELIIHFLDAYGADSDLPMSELLRRSRIAYLKAAQGLPESVLKLEKGEEVEAAGELQTHLASLLEWHVFGSPFARFGCGSAEPAFRQRQLFQDKVELSRGEAVTAKFVMVDESSFPVLHIRADWEKGISADVEMQVFHNGLLLYQIHGNSHTVYQKIKDTCIGGYDDGATYRAYFLLPLFRRAGENEVTIRLVKSPKPIFIVPDSTIDTWTSDIGSRYIEELEWNGMPEQEAAPGPVAVVSRPETGDGVKQ